MSTREALTALIHHVLISCAHQVRMGLPIREAAVEEIGAWPTGNEHGLNTIIYNSRNYLMMYLTLLILLTAGLIVSKTK